jgi:4-hydroxybenzoate polyprenyltransferase
MSTFLNWFKLIRWSNLAIIALTQIVVRYGIIQPMIEYMNLGMKLELSTFNFILLMLSTLLIAAAGYIINDYFDNNIDRINKPKHVVVGRSISRRQAMLTHTLLNVLGVGLGFWVAYNIGVFKLGLIQLFSTGLLWFYSTDFKKRLLAGNLIIALLTALVPFTVLLFEIPPLISAYRIMLSDLNLNFNHIMIFVGGYAAFAFITTLVREIIKDMEDVLGDQQFGCETMPIVWGMKISKVVSTALIFFTMSLLAYIMSQQFQDKDHISFAYFLTFLQIPSIWLILKLVKANSPKDFHAASRVQKIIMLAGVFYALVFKYLLIDRLF